MYEGGWILLGERAGHEIALGLVGKFWRPVIEFARITNAEELRDFDEPGFAKTVYDLSVRELGSGQTPLSGLMRTATTDEHAPLVPLLLDPSALARERTSSSAPFSTPHGARPKSNTMGN